MTDKLLEIMNLRTHFLMTDGVVRAVDGIDLSIDKMQTVGLVGESGSGKSVTALSILRLVPFPGKIINGYVLFMGRDLLKATEDEMRDIRGRHISMVFQDPFTFLNPVMRVKDQIAEMILTHRSDAFQNKKEIEDYIVQLLNNMKIASPENVKEYYPHQLSGGMRQRIVLATALACGPSLVILDEPTTALDVTTQMQIFELLKELKKEKNLSLLLITHDLGIVAELCDKIYIMYAGHIMEYGNVYDIFDDPAHPYTSGLLETVFSIDEFRPTIKFIDGSVPPLINPPGGCRFNPRCPHTKDICKEKRPETIEVGEGHFVSCWLWS